MKVMIKLLCEHAEIPTRATDGSIGYDLYACENALIIPGHPRAVSCGFALEGVKGVDVQIRPRSGLALKGISVFNSPGTIDPDYEGEIKVILFNIGGEIYAIKRGDRIAQMVFASYTTPEVEVVESVKSGSTRGDGGFGSTGN